MFKNYIKLTLRNLWKNRVFTSINVLGMGLSLSCCILAYVNYGYFGKYDSTHDNINLTYRVNLINENSGDIKRYGISPIALKSALESKTKGSVTSARYRTTLSNVSLEDELFSTRMAYVDKEFIQIFNLPLIGGSYENLSNSSSIYLSEESSEKYFGQANAIGRIIEVIFDGSKKKFTVEGVFQDWEQNSSFQFDLFTNFNNLFYANTGIDENDWSNYCMLFIGNVEKQNTYVIEKDLREYVGLQNKTNINLQITGFYLDPFQGMADRDQKLEVVNQWLVGRAPTAVVTVPIIMAALILLIACFNFTNTSIAIFSKRLKEIGIRKVMGSERSSIIIQFLGETLILCIIATVLSLVMTSFLIDWYNNLWSFLHLKVEYSIQIIIFLIILISGAAVMSGGYPSFYISKFQASNILKGTVKLGGTNFFVRSLLTLQFTLSLIAIVFAIAFVNNARFQKNLDLGFETEGIIYTKMDNSDQLDTYKNQLAQNSDIEAVVGSDDHIYSSAKNVSIRCNGINKDVKMMDIGEKYLETMSIKIIAGRDFIENSQSDELESIIVNEEFLRHFALTEPLNTKITLMDTVSYYVVGVVKDMYLDGIWRPIEPLVLRKADVDSYTHLVVKTSSDKAINVNAAMEKEWKSIFPDETYTGKYQNRLRVYTQETNENIVKIFSFMGIIATLLSMTGLYSLVTLSIIKKMKEIGVRKVLGASISSLMLVINKEFIIIFLISSLIGSFVGFSMVDMVMSSSWAYYLKTGLGVIGFSILLLFLISSSVIIGKILRAARLNPTKTLRIE